MIAIIDYGAGNLHNVKNVLDYLEEESVITSDPQAILKAEKVILPGVGAFGQIMNSLVERGIDAAIKSSISSEKPFLGICLGCQALFEESQESPGVKGLGILKGSVKKFLQGKVPHVGWNNVNLANNQSSFEPGFAYFVHSYYPDPVDKSAILFYTDYYLNFCSGIKKANTLAVQFHPERSGQWGIEFFRRWLSIQ